MKLDILCPGSWMDSYESRLICEGFEVYSMHTVLTVLSSFFSSDNGRYHQELFRSFDLYLDGNLFGSYSYGNLVVFPTTETVIDDVTGEIGYRYPNGDKSFVLPVDDCIKYGINRRTVNPDTDHAW